MLRSAGEGGKLAGSHVKFSDLGNKTKTRSLKKKGHTALKEKNYIPKVLVEAFDVSVYNLERVQLVLTSRYAAHEIQGRITTINHFRIWAEHGSGSNIDGWN